MTKLNWTYTDGRPGEPCQTANYRGLIIAAIQDCHAQSPFDDMDGIAPTAVYYDRSLTEHVDGALDPLGDMTPAVASRHWHKIAAAVELDAGIHDAEARERAKDYGESLGEARLELFRDALRDMAPSSYGGANAGDYFTAIAALWTIQGVAALDWYSTGYSQGDYAYGVSVATPAFLKLTGCPADRAKEACEQAEKLYTAWAWGDVYGYSIQTPDGDNLDSCWGYYGSEHDESGLEESAIDAADWIIQDASKRRAAKLKELVRNRVPLGARAPLLAAASTFQGAH